jgi:hypothetical protein
MGRVGELEVVRWLCYTGFFASVLMLMAGLTFTGQWVAAGIGTGIFGFLTARMYEAEAARRQFERERGQYAAEHGPQSAVTKQQGPFHIEDGEMGP